MFEKHRLSRLERLDEIEDLEEFKKHLQERLRVSSTTLVQQIQVHVKEASLTEEGHYRQLIQKGHTILSSVGLIFTLLTAVATQFKGASHSTVFLIASSITFVSSLATCIAALYAVQVRKYQAVSLDDMLHSKILSAADLKLGTEEPIIYQRYMLAAKVMMLGQHRRLNHQLASRVKSAQLLFFLTVLSILLLFASTLLDSSSFQTGLSSNKMSITLPEQDIEEVTITDDEEEEISEPSNPQKPSDEEPKEPEEKETKKDIGWRPGGKPALLPAFPQNIEIERGRCCY